MSAIAPLHGSRFRVSGMKAGFACDGLDPQEEQLREGLRPGDPGFGEDGEGWLGADADAAGSADAGGAARIPIERGNYVAFYEGVRDWARGEMPAPVDPWDAVRVLELLELARA
jgi:hypothetical protein